ncbi:hypothetical protein M153_4180005391 [Pseudoloma neurophilia]|uniref:Uncharacterized protein n=1 Tax=Pseudoloma neurophilia TaxID=146866 RepID=A0A0R0M3M5_9MICR|nr:hypothetical protein M153_4180005391 [Pseudoloma neurophilia]
MNKFFFLFFNMAFPRNDEIAKLIDFFEDSEDISLIQWLVRNNLIKDSFFAEAVV